MKILIIGMGVLGLKLGEIGAKKCPISGTFNGNIPIVDFPTSKLDITDRDSTFKIIDRFSPDWVVQTAAMTHVDGCERDRAKAYDINVNGTGNVARACAKTGAKMVYVSSDYIFDGEKGSYSEDGSPNPISYYGRTKLLGEEKVEEALEDFVITRTSVIYGKEKKNFATWIIDELKRGNEIRIVTDQYVSPTLNTDLAEQIYALINNSAQDIYNTAGGERISRYDFSVKLADVFGLDKSLIIPIKTEDLDWTAMRPMDSSLDISKISKIKKPLSIEEALTRLREEIQ